MEQGGKETPSAARQEYDLHRHRILRLAVLRGLAVLIGILVLYFGADVAFDGLQAEDAVYYGTLSIFLVLAFALLGLTRQDAIGATFLSIDGLMTLVVAMRLALSESTTVSGTALVLSRADLGDRGRARGAAPARLRRRRAAAAGQGLPRPGAQTWLSGGPF